MFEPWVRNSMFEPGVWGTMLEPRVLVLLPFQGVRTLGSDTLCSNPGFGELYVGTPGSGTPSSSREFEPWVWELHMFRQISIVTMVAEKACSMIVRRSGAWEGGAPSAVLEACR